MADKPASLIEALAILQTRLPHIAKDQAMEITGRRTHKYAGLATISQAILPLLGELGLAFSCMPTIRENGQLVLHYALMHTSEPDGALIGDYPLPSGSPQTVGSAITYARRYCLCAVTGVAPDDDDDGQAAEDAARAELAALHARGPEVDEHGAATFAEQTRAMYGHVPGVQRETATAPSDLFYILAPHEEPAFVDRNGDFIQHAPAVKAVRKMFANYTKLGITDDDVMRGDIGTILGRVVASRGGLSAEEVGRVNSVLLDRLAEATK